MNHPVADPRIPGDPETRAMFRALLLCELIELVDVIASDGERHDAVASLAPRRAVPALHAMTEVRGALDRLDDGTYGTCGNCRQPIPLDELRDAPSVTACRTCEATPVALRSHAGHQGPSRLRHRTRIWPRSSR